MKFDLTNYETVQERLDVFHKQHKDNARVVTELLEASERRFIIRASVYIGNELKATGHAEETVGSNPVNKTSAIENCETSAIGRALRNAGIGKEASREEMQKVERRNAELEIEQSAHIAVEAAHEVANSDKTPEEKLNELRAIYKSTPDEVLKHQISWINSDGQSVDGAVGQFLQTVANIFKAKETNNE